MSCRLFQREQMTENSSFTVCWNIVLGFRLQETLSLLSLCSTVALQSICVVHSMDLKKFEHKKKIKINVTAIGFETLVEAMLKNFFVSSLLEVSSGYLYQMDEPVNSYQS